MYTSMFVDEYSRATIRGGEEAYPTLFWKSRKGILILEKKGPDCTDLWDKFYIQNVVYN